MNDRHSSPPANPDDVAARLKVRLDQHEAAERGIVLTDEQRREVVREIYGEMRCSGGSTQVALERYEDKVRARLAKAAE